MSFEMLHFNDAEKVFTKKKLTKDIQLTMQYVDETLQGRSYRGELLRQALSDMDWRNGDLNILDGRRYYYKGMKKGVAIDGSFSSYEYLLTGLFRLQIGFVKETVDAGILLLPSTRGEKSPLGTTAQIVSTEIKMINKSITVPVCICLFDLGIPIASEENQVEEETIPS
jgi:hypothetical protein